MAKFCKSFNNSFFNLLSSSDFRSVSERQISEILLVSESISFLVCFDFGRFLFLCRISCRILFSFGYSFLIFIEE